MRTLPTYTNQLRRLKPDFFVLAVGELTAPTRGTLDPEILCFYSDVSVYQIELIQINLICCQTE